MPLAAINDKAHPFAQHTQHAERIGALTSAPPVASGQSTTAINDKSPPAPETAAHKRSLGPITATCFPAAVTWAMICTSAVEQSAIDVAAPRGRPPSDVSSPSGPCRENLQHRTFERFFTLRMRTSFSRIRQRVRFLGLRIVWDRHQMSHARAQDLHFFIIRKCSKVRSYCASPHLRHL